MFVYIYEYRSLVFISDQILNALAQIHYTTYMGWSFPGFYNHCSLFHQSQFKNCKFSFFFHNLGELHSGNTKETNHLQSTILNSKFLIFAIEYAELPSQNLADLPRVPSLELQFGSMNTDDENARLIGCMEDCTETFESQLDDPVSNNSERSRLVMPVILSLILQYLYVFAMAL